MNSLMPWRRSGALSTFQQEMEQLFNRFFAPIEPGEKGFFSAWSPSVDVSETDAELTIKADLPGIDAKDVEIMATEGSLVIRGEKKEEKEDKKANYRRVERFVGQFHREIPLPAGVDASKITATGANGVITITVPKSEKVQPKKIAVKAAN